MARRPHTPRTAKRALPLGDTARPVETAGAMPSYLDEVDFAAIQQRFDAFWRREEVLGRPLVQISAPRQERKAADIPVPKTLRQRWLDAHYRIKAFEIGVENTLFLGEAFPAFQPNIGPDSFAAFLGAELRFVDEATSWVEPFVDDLGEWEPRLDPANQWWQAMMELIDAACEAGRGRYLVGIPDMHGGGDALAAVRHPDRLALDLYDQPAEVQRVMQRMTELYIQLYDVYYGKVSRVQEGSTAWLSAYSRGRYSALQNDFSGLCSPAMFERFFLADVAQIAGRLDNSLYHLDGPSALGNLPLLLGIEPLDGIQWVPGAGSKPMSQWVDVCRTVLEAGKCLHIHCAPAEVQSLLRQLPHGGLCISTGCATEQDARELLRRVERGCF